MKVSVFGKNFGAANDNKTWLQILEPITKISFGRTLGAKLPQSHMWYWVYNCVYNWLNLEKITFFFLQLQSCDRHSITFRNHLKYIQGPPTHIDIFQTNIFSWFNDSVIQTQWFLGSWDREIWYKTLFFHFFNLTWPPWPQKEKI